MLDQFRKLKSNAGNDTAAVDIVLGQTISVYKDTKIMLTWQIGKYD